jgi:N-carbamoyl-L-amino-acid hydrolase
VVSSIVGLGGAVVEFHGRADHAGTTPMTARQDPMRAAADLIAGLPGIAASVSPAAVATCGRVDTQPGGANIVPSLVQVTLDFRDPDPASLTALGDRIRARAAEAARAHGVTPAWLPDEQIAPTALDARVQAVIQGHAARPAGMIFVPSIGGRSHCPEEHTDWRDVTNGANVLLNTLVELATAGLG